MKILQLKTLAQGIQKVAGKCTSEVRGFSGNHSLHLLNIITALRGRTRSV